MSKSLLLICRHSPWSGLSARETLDMALSGGAFELPVSMLWLDEGVWQLTGEQQPGLLEQKNLQAQLSALSLFGIDRLYVSGAALERRELEASSLSLEVEILDDRQICELIRQHHQVVGL